MPKPVPKQEIETAVVKGVENQVRIKRNDMVFDIPKYCGNCPMHGVEHDMNATIDFCTLLDGDLSQVGIRIEPGKRDYKCPLKPGAVYSLK